MTTKLTLRQFVFLLPFILGLLLNIVYTNQKVHAQVTNPQDGSVALEGTIPTDPPSTGATISFPGNGQTFQEVPIDVTGICPNGLLVKLFKNEVFAGSAVCNNGSFSITIDLFRGENILLARVYDDLDQPGPDSNSVTVNFDDGGAATGPNRVIITSNFSRRGAFPGNKFTWPFIISNGEPPYAVNIDWGDGTSDLVSRPIPGEFILEHVYEKPGTYVVIVKVTDVKGVTSYLQLVAVINGPVGGSTNESGAGPDGQAQADSISQRTITKVLVWPMYVLIGLILVAFWFGKRYEIKKLRKRLASDQPLNF
jgi:hypothetical protein